MKKFDVIVIGGGHAGCEAAYASAKSGASTAMITLDRLKIGAMSCNPAIGGLAKGQMAKEVDALGGVMGRITDLATIQYRRLNLSKGPAVRSSRAQCDKHRYAKFMQDYLATVPNLTVIEDEVLGLVVKSGKIEGIRLAADTLAAPSVVITSGTFLKAIMHIGKEQEEGGRVGDRSSNTLSDDLVGLGFKLHRLKTGTPPRLHKDSIRWDVTTPQPGDDLKIPFSFYHAPQPYPHLDQVNCYLTWTNEKTHEIIEKNLKLSAMYSGAISGVGPRYCPAVEDKIARFRDKDRHQIFLEPEGLDVDEIYANGISSSLPREVQEQFVHSIVGLEEAKFIRYGYAVEYDAIDARVLGPTLESKDISGLFFAGQVNGTSGYEEAAGQGWVAGVNASRKSLGMSEFTLGRSDAYIGVMIDDLIVKGTDEPYRMFTSRAEYRLLLREDNADLRLSPSAIELGLFDERMKAAFYNKLETLAQMKTQISESHYYPTEETNQVFQDQGISKIRDRVSVETLLRRPEVNFSVIEMMGREKPALDFKNWGYAEREQIEIQVKYNGYIQKDLELLEGVRKAENVKIPADFDYSRVSGLSNEILGKLKGVRPVSIGQAARVQGVTPAAVANLMIHLRNHKSSNTQPPASS